MVEHVKTSTIGPSSSEIYQDSDSKTESDGLEDKDHDFFHQVGEGTESDDDENEEVVKRINKMGKTIATFPIQESDEELEDKDGNSEHDNFDFRLMLDNFNKTSQSFSPAKIPTTTPRKSEKVKKLKSRKSMKKQKSKMDSKDLMRSQKSMLNKQGSDVQG